MGKLLCALVVIVASASISFGQTTTTATKAGSGKVEEEIRSLHQRIREAVTRHDKAALEAIYADEFLFIHTTGSLDTKDEYIAKSLTTDASAPLTAPDTEYQRMDVYGDVAVRTARVRARLAGGQGPLLWVTSVYVKRNGRWQIVRMHGTRMPAERTAVKVDTMVLDAYIGKYEFAPGAYSTITREGDALMAQRTGRTKVTLLPESETQFFVKGGDAQITFYKDDRGRVTHLIIRRGNGQEERAKKVE
jgi:ketosteroid isomerase-like protein